MKIRPVSFPIEKTFPPSDPLAIDLLRLMAGYNDLVLVIEWLEEHPTEPPDFYETTWAAGRLDLQLRLLFAIMHEILNVMEDMQKLPGFLQLEERLDGNGQSALAYLRRIITGQDYFGKTILAMTRHKTAYHYDHDEFGQGLKRLLDRFGPDSQTNTLFIEHKSGSEQYYHPLADMIRVEITQGLTGAANTEYLDKLLALTRSYGVFLESLLKAYASDRGLSTDFSFMK